MGQTCGLRSELLTLVHSSYRLLGIYNMPGPHVFYIHLIFTILLCDMYHYDSHLLILIPLNPCHISMRQGLVTLSCYRFQNQCLEKELAMMTQW